MIRFVCMLIACSMGISLAASPVTNDASQAGGKEVLKVEITEGQIDVISGVVYSQTPLLRANRALKMTLLIPRTKELKPAVVFYPGGGFTSAAHERYFEMRMALAKAGFVVAAAEYRVVPDKYPALVVDAKAAVRFACTCRGTRYRCIPYRSAWRFCRRVCRSDDGNDQW